MLPVISLEPILSLERIISAFVVIASIFGECLNIFRNNTSGKERIVCLSEIGRRVPVC